MDMVFIAIAPDMPPNIPFLKEKNNSG